MRRKLSVLILAVVMLLQVFSPAVFAVSKNKVESQTVSFCSLSLTSEGAAKTEINILGKGSTGRTVANNLNEQLAMKEVVSNPLDGAKQLK